MLRQSYRCPISVQNLSQEIIDRVKYRQPKEWKGTNKNGFVQYHNYPGSVDLQREGTWLVLGRTQYILDRIEAQSLRLEGTIYHKKWKVACVPKAPQCRLNRGINY